MLIPGDLLVRRISPIAIDSEFVLISLRLKQFRNAVPLILVTLRIQESSSNLDLFTRLDLSHRLTLPVIELSAYLHIFAAKTPFKYVLNLFQQFRLLELILHLDGLICCLHLKSLLLI